MYSCTENSDVCTRQESYSLSRRNYVFLSPTTSIIYYVEIVFNWRKLLKQVRVQLNTRKITIIEKVFYQLYARPMSSTNIICKGHFWNLRLLIYVYVYTSDLLIRKPTLDPVNLTLTIQYIMRLSKILSIAFVMYEWFDLIIYSFISNGRDVRDPITNIIMALVYRLNIIWLV